MNHTDFAIRTAIICGIGTLAVWLAVCLPINEYFIHKALLEHLGPHEYLKREIPKLMKKYEATRTPEEPQK